MTHPAHTGTQVAHAGRAIQRHWRIALCWTALLPASWPALAAPLLECEISQGGSVLTLASGPVSDPYQVESRDINGRFRFKAVMVGGQDRVDYISLYTYDLDSGRPVLLHQAKYAGPFRPHAMQTGRHYVYSPRLGRELEYQCKLTEATP